MPDGTPSGTPILGPNGTPADNSFKQNEIKGRINWILTGKSRLQFLGGWVERNNAFFSNRDFNGFNARLVYNWRPTGKIGVTLSGWRETAAAQNLTANFSLNEGVSIAPSWSLTEKINITGDFSYVSRKFDRFSRNTDALFPTGTKNTFTTASMKLTYTPYYGIEISATAYHNGLSSNSPLGDFNANGANINLRYILGRP
jgi:hypothetical protein